eukprot:1320149-Amphidinium_carterae.1
MCKQFLLDLFPLFSHGSRAYDENNVYKDTVENKEAERAEYENSRARAYIPRGGRYGLFDVWYDYLAVKRQPPRLANCTEDTKYGHLHAVVTYTTKKHDRAAYDFRH